MCACMCGDPPHLHRGIPACERGARAGATCRRYIRSPEAWSRPGHGPADGSDLIYCFNKKNSCSADCQLAAPWKDTRPLLNLVQVGAPVICSYSLTTASDRTGTCLLSLKVSQKALIKTFFIAFKLTEANPDSYRGTKERSWI